MRQLHTISSALLTCVLLCIEVDQAAAAEFLVISTDDAVDVDPGDGSCGFHANAITVHWATNNPRTRQDNDYPATSNSPGSDARDPNGEYAGEADIDAGPSVLVGNGHGDDPVGMRGDETQDSRDVGACCFADGSCELYPEQDCGTAGGTFQGIGTVCDPNPCPFELGCPVGSLFAQAAYGPSEPWILGVSDVGFPYLRYENFSGATGDICSVRWWGAEMDSSRENCVQDPDAFEIRFYLDDGGQPGAEACSYTIASQRVDTGLRYHSTYHLALYEFSATLVPCCNLSDGWISIQGVGEATCRFWWLSASVGDQYHCGDDGVQIVCGAPDNLFDFSVCLIAFTDCNSNGVDDALELAASFEGVSPFTAITMPAGVVYDVIEGPPRAEEPGTVRFEVDGDNAPSGSVSVQVNGTLLGTGGFNNPGCESQRAIIDVPSSDFNAAVAAGGGDATVIVTIAGGTTCTPVAYAQVTTSYAVDQSPDCNSDGVPDECELAGGTSADCQGNLVPDECDISGCTSTDCLPDAVPDECQPDCNANGQGDDCDIFYGSSFDCNVNGQPDECDLMLSPGDISLLILGADDSANLSISELVLSGYFADIQGIEITNAVPDYAAFSGYDAILVYTNSAPDSPALLGDRLADYVDGGGRLAIATYAYSDPLAIAGRIMTAGYSPLVNTGDKGGVGPTLIPTVPSDPIFEGIDLGGVSYFKNSFFAHADLDAGATLLAKDASDVNMIARNAAGNVYGLNLYPAKHSSNNAEYYRLLARILTFPSSGSRDCQGDSIPDECQLSESDCNFNAIPDACDIAAATSVDCLPDGIPDECQPDCNANGIGDDCDTLPGGASSDCQGDQIPDECQLANNDCNTNGVPDDCDTGPSGTSLDCQPDGIPDECQLGPGEDCNRTGVPDTCELYSLGDVDGDGDTDLVELAVFVEAMTGPDRLIINEHPNCWLIYHLTLDYNLDLHIDLVDFAELQRTFTQQ